MFPKHKVRALFASAWALCVLCTAARGQTITVGPASLPNGEVGVAYNQGVTALETPASATCCTWGVTGAGSLSIIFTGPNSTTAQISGTPTAAASPLNFSVTASDAGSGATPGNQAYSITIYDKLQGIGITNLPSGTQGTPYSVPLTSTVTGGDSAAFVWTLGSVSPSAPWLSLNSSTGVLGGNPVVGTYSVPVQLTDGFATLNQTFTLSISPAPLAVATNSLPNGEASAPYNPPNGLALSATGGVPPYSWNATGLPAGLGITSGAITGTLSATATTANNVVLTVTDSTNATASSAALTLTVTPGPGITTAATLPGGEVNVAYSQTLAASGGSGSYTWALASGSVMPAGLSISSAGVITGPPTAATATPASFTIKVTDSAGGTASQVFTISITAGLTITTPAALPNGEVNVAYSQTLAVSGGSAPYTWALASGSTPPAGLSLSSAGVITGPPTAATTTPASFTVTVTDKTGGTASQTFTVTIFAALSISPGSLPNGEATAPYSQTLAASGGSGAGLVWALANGSALPPGLGINGAIISGTPTTTGPFNFTVNVTDSLGGAAQKTYTITIAAGPGITTTVLPGGEVTAPYSQALAVTDPTTPAPYTWSVSSGLLPVGLSLSPAGAITGTPSAAGPASFTVQVTDTAGGKATQSLSITIIAGPTITSKATLTKGEVGAAYSQTLAASGGSNTGFVWSVAVGSSLPAGLSFSAAGVLSGMPTAAALGTSSFTVEVTDSANGIASLAVSITIVGGPAITTAPALPNGTVGVAYTNVTLAASSGTAPYTWSITQGSLPQGLSLDPNAGTITGVPNTATNGPSNFTVQVTDAKGVTASKQFSITIAAGLTITTAPVLPIATTSVPYSVTVSAAGGTPPYSWSITTGSLPNGLTLNSATGVISGVPSSSGTYQISLQVTDSASVTAIKVFNLTVAQTLAITTTSLPSGAVGTPYSLSLSAVGGTPPYTFIISAGSMPTGLSLSATAGLIYGTPASTGTFTFTIQVRDANLVSASQQFSLTVVTGLGITTNPVLPEGVVNTPYSQALAASGGTAPYTWALVQPGSLPAGLSLIAGVITGIPKANGTSTFSIQINDSVGATATKQFSLTIVAGLAIVNAGLPAGTVGQAYGPIPPLAAVGGTSPYTWSISVGSLPPGLSLSANGFITGTPNKAGNFNFTVQVKDNNGSTATLAFTISVILPAVPQVNLAGVPQSSPAAQQISFGVSLASGYPLDIQGAITMSFDPDAVAPATDPALQFSSGGLTTSFTIPANTTSAVFGSSSQIGLQTGTISGAINLTFTLQAGGVPLPSSGLDRTITIPRAVPVIQSVKMVKTSGGLEVHVVGFSSSRDLTEADLTFTAAPGATLQTTTSTQSLSSVAGTWYQGASSTQYGSQLMLVLPFSVTQGSADAVGNVAVVLKNAQGRSPSLSGTF